MVKDILLPLNSVPDQLACCACRQGEPLIIIGFLRSVQLPASAAAAAAGLALRFNRHMPGLSGIAASAFIQLSADDDPRADP
ncbi:hypothetical protein D3C80_1750490 [compost metagenome]